MITAGKLMLMSRREYDARYHEAMELGRVCERFLDPDEPIPGATPTEQVSRLSGVLRRRGHLTLLQGGRSDIVWSAPASPRGA